MQAYMKSSMPYLGVPLPATRRIARRGRAAHPPADVADLLDRGHRRCGGPPSTAKSVMPQPNSPGLRMAAGRLELLPLYREMIVTGAWWDHVDGVSPADRRPAAGPPVGDAAGDPRVVGDPDRWLRRSSIICQLGAQATARTWTC